MGMCAELIPPLPNFLEDGVKLSEDEKKDRFDELKALYDDMLDKVAAYEQRCEYIEKEILIQQQGKSKKKQKKSADSSKKKTVSKTYSGPPDWESSACFEPFDGVDSSLPEGWKTGWRIMDGFSKGTRSRVFWDPSGKYMTSRISSLEHMKTNLESSEEDIQKMYDALLEEGWENSEKLPEGWLLKKDKSAERKIKVFMTRNYKYCKNTKVALKQLVTQEYDELELSKFLTNFVFKFDASPEAIEWIKDENIPQNWKVAKIEGRDNLIGISPEGTYYASKKGICEAVQASEELTEVEKEKVVGFLYKNNRFQAPIKLEEPDKDQKKSDIPSTPRTTSLKNKVSKDQMKYDDLLPKGWSYADVMTDRGEARRIFGPIKSYFGTGHAIKQVFDEEGESQTVKELRSFMLQKDGWMETEYLPEGYIFKQKQQEAGFLYFNEKYEKFNTLKQLMAYFKVNNLKEFDTFEEDYKKLTRNSTFRPRKKKVKQEKDEEFALSDSEFDDKEKEDDSVVSELENESVSDSMDVDEEDVQIKSKQPSFDDSDNEEDESNENDMENSDEEEEAEELDWDLDTFIPMGWKMNTFETPSGDVMSRYQSPCGTYFGNLPQVLKFLDANTTYSDFDRNLFKRRLEGDGWRKDEDNGKGWYKKTFKGRDTQFMSPKFDVLLLEDISSYKNTALKLEELDSKAKEFKEELDSKEKESKVSHKISWKSSSSIPTNWKIGETVDKDGESIKKFLSPRGQMFDTRPGAIRYMMETKRYSNEDITMMQLGMSEDDWMFDENLPVGWFKKRYGSSWRFSTSNFQVLKSSAEVLKHFLQTGASKDVIQKFSSILKSTSDTSPKTPAKSKANIKKEAIETSPSSKRKQAAEEKNAKRLKPNSQDQKVSIKSEKVEKESLELPPNWRIELEDDVEVIYSDKEVKFKSRREAAEFMIKNSYNPKQIYNLWNTLDQEGWMANNSMIPAGWRLKKYPDLYDYKYITRELKVLHSSEEALDTIKKEADLMKYKEKFTSWLKEVSRKEPKLTWKSDSTVAKDWELASGTSKLILKYKVTGGRFESRKEAIDYMIKGSQSSSEIFTMWNSLDVEGWISDEDHLPRGWRRKCMSKDKRTYHFLSPMMEVVQSRRGMLDLLKTSKDYSKSDISRFERWNVKQSL